MKLKFMLQGGYMPPYVVYQPVLTNTGRARTRGGSSGIFDSISSSSSKSSSKDNDNKDDVTAKDILLMLDKTKALPIDRNAISARVLSLIGISSISGAVDPSLMAMEYLRTMNDLKNASFAYDEYASTWRLAQSKDALNEVALSPDNKLYVKTEDGNISPISIELYQLHKDELGEPLTNSLLMHYRAYMSSNPAILDSVANAISLDTVNSLIHSYIGTIGYDETSKTTMLKKKDLTILNGVEALQKAADDGDYNSEAGLDGIYALVETNHNNVEDIDKMLNYVYDMLPKRAKALLDYHGNGEKGAKEIIAQFVTAGTIKKTNFSDTLKFDINGKKVGSKSSSTGSSKTQLSPVMTFLLGRGYQLRISLNPGSPYSIVVNGRISALADSTGRPIGTGHNLSEIGNSLYASVLDLDHATFGGQELNLLEGHQSILKNTDIVLVELPIDLHAPEGVIRPDIGMCNRIEQANDYIQLNNINEEDFEKVNEVYEKFNLPPKYKLIQTNDGILWSLNTLEYKTFAMIQSVVNGGMLKNTDKISSEDLQNNVIERITDSSTIEAYAQLMKELSPGKKFSFDDTNLFWGLGFFDWKDAMYEGNVFIPVRTGAFVNASLLVPSRSRLEAPIGDSEQVYQNQLNNLLGELVNPELNYVAPPNLNSLE